MAACLAGRNFDGAHTPAAARPKRRRGRAGRRPRRSRDAVLTSRTARRARVGARRALTFTARIGAARRRGNRRSVDGEMVGAGMSAAAEGRSRSTSADGPRGPRRAGRAASTLARSAVSWPLTRVFCARPGGPRLLLFSFSSFSGLRAGLAPRLAGCCRPPARSLVSGGRPRSPRPAAAPTASA